MKLKRSGMLISLITLAACQPAPTPQATHTPSAALPAATETTSPTATSIPPTLTTTSTSTISPTWTPLSTLAEADKENFVLNLMQTNSGCKLPCWWGFTPGVSSWAEIKAFTQQFADRITETPLGYIVENNQAFAVRLSEVWYLLPGSQGPSRALFNFRNGKAEYIQITPIGTEYAYQLNKMLHNYGIPQEVFYSVNHNSSGTTLSLFVTYPDLGIIAEYVPDVESTGENYSGCFSDIPPRLWLFPPRQIESLLSSSLLSPEYIDDLSSLEEIVGISPQDFYETYKDREVQDCLTVPYIP